MAEIVERLRELPDDVRVPLHSLQADAEYLIGRVCADGSCGRTVVASIKQKLGEIEKAVIALIEPQDADDYIDQLNVLCEDFGCEPGSDRLAWLHDQLSKASELNAAIELKAAIEQKDQIIAGLERLVYVPGLWRCAKCDFQLAQANLNAADGSVSARDQPGDKCPNCDVPLWRVTERDAGNRMVDRCEQAVIENAELRKIIAGLLEAIEPFEKENRDYCASIDGSTRIWDCQIRVRDLRALSEAASKARSEGG